MGTRLWWMGGGAAFIAWVELWNRSTRSSGKQFRMVTSRAQLTLDEIKYEQGLSARGVVGSRGRDAVARQGRASSSNRLNDGARLPEQAPSQKLCIEARERDKSNV
jgi:hypothetical protein